MNGGGALPDGAQWFPDEGGIQWQGRIYYPADYVLTRNDIAAIRAETRREAAADIASRVRANCTVPSAVASPTSDAVVYAVADWIERYGIPTSVNASAE